MHFTACDFNLSFVRVGICLVCFQKLHSPVLALKQPFKELRTIIISSISGLKFKLVLTKIEQKAHTHTFLCQSTSLLTSEPGTLAPSHARQTYGWGSTKGLFTLGGVLAQGATTQPPHTVTTLHTPTSLTICCPVAACRVRKP